MNKFIYYSTYFILGGCVGGLMTNIDNGEWWSGAGFIAGFCLGVWALWMQS
jgi:hypothetical protein